MRRLLTLQTALGLGWVVAVAYGVTILWNYDYKSGPSGIASSR